jgi:hypothetical protein
MRPVAQRVANAIRLNAPQGLCFTCLAAQHHLNEHDLRAVALVLVSRLGLGLARRACDACGRVD